ncbi:MAG: hypothetical protein AW07_03797 [Candidatus Accumulibacter sp. SK-11]|nr:MAG: hypothetical protein AW07_03797 [Candidatus Accumulibacter sp. SK-11]
MTTDRTKFADFCNRLSLPVAAAGMLPLHCHDC